ncbi:MAG: hypothetical protein OXU23_06085 [Candidatus Poribacteria bacterium]|nr:hypothetical protein [Candidatus Poribacteria bacterium]
MKKETRDRAKRFLTSESGRVGIRAPLALGVASGTLLLSQGIHTPSAEAGLECLSNDDCGSEGRCDWACKEYSEGTCVTWESKCVYDS